MYDLKKWFQMPSVTEGFKLPNGQIYGRETHHLEGMNLTNNTKVYAYHYDTGKTMVFSKAPQKDNAGHLTLGWPWDFKPYDEKFIYDGGTELDWTSPRDYKMQVTPIPMCQRYWDGDMTTYQASQHVAYHEFRNCIQGNPGDVGPAYYTIEGPFSVDFLGDVGFTEVILVTYYWDDPKHREQLFLTRTVGWVKWTHSLLTQVTSSRQQYVVDSVVVHNKIVLGQVTPSFPCGIIV